MRAEKNEIEIKGMRNAHLKDAVALCDFLAYLEEQIELNAVSWDELQIARVVNSFRLEQNDSEGISFETVVGYGPHGAIPHYKPTNLTNVKIEFDSTLVIDSGGQYRGLINYFLNRRKIFLHFIMLTIRQVLKFFCFFKYITIFCQNQVKNINLQN